MIDDVEDGRHHGQLAVEAEQQRDQPEMADGRVGQQPLQVVLEDRDVGAEQQGGEAGRPDDPEPGLGPRHHRPEARHQEHAGLHQGRRMQVGRHRGRSRHGVRQPEMERELRALGQGAEQDEDQRRQVERMRPDPVARGQHEVEVVAADDVAQDQNAGEQAQPAGGGDGQRHAGTVARGRRVVPVADQQEGEEAGQLPEEGQLDQVAGKHHAGHGPHEGEQEREEARHRIFRRHVVSRVEHHESADA